MEHPVVLRRSTYLDKKNQFAEVNLQHWGRIFSEVPFEFFGGKHF